MKNLKKLAALFTAKIDEKSLDVISNNDMAQIYGGRPEQVMNTHDYWWFEDIAMASNMKTVAR
ncbi:bacteriocin [Mucilaginibacter sp. KACC 22063]|uniref:bacteriocin n=1 Tax=Mucilaginibacter sp. KACC 22063 TaxID=3025666 RepID=UPI0023664D76|nr:bacteriocin [Mucilaginibacter sp. KACC 22063]WDF56045.1 bacteriocin [Mucilaginibacter sp. KACC 22063]